MEGSILRDVIDIYGENGANEVLEVLHFMLKKMEPDAKRKNNADAFISHIENVWDIHTDSEYNPLIPKE